MKLTEWSKELNKMKNTDGKMVRPALEMAKCLKQVTELLEKNLQKLADGKVNACAPITCAILQSEAELNFIRDCLDFHVFEEADDERDKNAPTEKGRKIIEDMKQAGEAHSEEKANDIPLGNPIFIPLGVVAKPCSVKEKTTVKDFFLKVDEEVDEWKEAVLRVAELDTPVSKVKNASDFKLTNIAEEAADIKTILTSFDEAANIHAYWRNCAQKNVNERNKVRGRW